MKKVNVLMMTAVSVLLLIGVAVVAPTKKEINFPYNKKTRIIIGNGL